MRGKKKLALLFSLFNRVYNTKIFYMSEILNIISV
jgi:hypothetical protein